MGKSFRRGPDGRAAKPEDYRLGKLFVPENVAVRDIRGLHGLWERLALDGDAFCVRGTLSGQSVPKGTKAGNRGGIELQCDHVTRRNGGGLYSDGFPAGLAEASHHWLFLDMDKVLNIKCLDPRTQPDAALEFLLGLLPPTIRQATVSWNWSSSMCVDIKIGQAPERLSAHLRIWLDQPLDCQQTRALLEQLREHAWLRLEELGVVRDGKHDNVVDWKVSEAQQPLYLASPRFEEGLHDPFPGGARRGLLAGRADVVCLADLEKQLAAVLPVPPAPAPAEPRRRAPVHAKKEKSARAAPRPLPEMDGGQAGVVPFSAARRLESARKHRACRSLGERLCVDRAMFAARVPLEVVRLVRGRVEQGATDRRWRAWHLAGGVPEGQRDMVLFLTGCLIAESMDVADLTDAKVNQAILEVGRLIVEQDWLREAWVEGRYWSSLVGRAVADGRGEYEIWGGVLKSKSYWVGKARMLRELRVLPEEAARYGLLSLATDRDRLAAKRIGNGATPRHETQEQNTTKAKVARRLMADGMSLREAAKRVDMDASQLSRLLKVVAAANETARQDHVRSADVPGVG